MDGKNEDEPEVRVHAQPATAGGRPPDPGPAEDKDKD